ncbi:DUF2490 domain-containing protein [Salinimicrobium sp. GXAS 041]|uniref:DUF2490 domain-containing protein n=1 Tax=Salinimicrobium sp. GXAS 041 TaxID=3400806 RepID=UPI003C76E9E3
MKKAFYYKKIKILFVVLFIFSNSTSISQEIDAYLLEPEFKVALSTETRWSYSFGFANRGVLLETVKDLDENDYANVHFEINHFTSYQAWEKSSLSLGLRYRFRKIFNDQREDEMRFIEQFSSKDSNNFLGWSHRARFEQRLRSSETIFRLRYEFGLSKQLNSHFTLQLATEALYAISPQSKPEPEQRLEIGLKNTTFDDWQFYFGTEFRRDNYVRNPQNELFFLTAATLKL